jgi:CO/xanthine dehydrogenase Mo-binding subunit
MSVQVKPLPPVELPPLRQVGKPVRRIDALAKAVGATVYAGDYSLPGMLHAKVLRSAQPSARLLRVDTSKAKALPGVVCILTSQDLTGGRVAGDMPGQTGQKRVVSADVPVLASGVVRFVGEPIALVAAETLEQAEQALRLIEVDYEALPGVFDPEAALQPGAPIVNPPDNVVARYKLRKGDLEAGMAKADVIVENTFRMGFVDHAYLEPEAGMAWVDERGVITIRVSTQVIEHFRSVAMALGVPQNQVRVQGTFVGGGFGGKEDVTVEIFLGLLAQRTRRPVRLVYTREESLLAHSKRHPFTITHRTGVTRDGHIVAAHINLIADSGAYPYLTRYVLLYAVAIANGPYRAEHLWIDGVAAATNNPFTSAFRGFGATQICVAYEQQMDEIARRLEMDPLELRRKNYVRAGDTTATGQVLRGEIWLEESATRALAALGEPATYSTPSHVRIGQGFASYIESFGRMTFLHDTSQAWVGMETDGSAVVRSGAPDLGGGQASSLCQITSEVLGVPMERITVYSSDTASTPLAGTSTATRQLFMSGNATLKAARAVREVLVAQASYQLEVAPEDLDLADGHAFVKADPGQRVALSEVAARCAAAGKPLANLALFQAPFSDPLDPETCQGNLYSDFIFGTQAVEVAVDTETGQVTVLKSVACHDVGRAINPAAVEGQIVGGSVMGMGYALTEELVVEEGRLKTPTLAEYLLPTAVDAPAVQTIILESGTGVGPFGAKGIGEPANTPIVPAIANAVANAIGVRIHDLPITPEKVLAALDACKGK